MLTDAERDVIQQAVDYFTLERGRVLATKSRSLSSPWPLQHDLTIAPLAANCIMRRLFDFMAQAPNHGPRRLPKWQEPITLAECYDQLNGLIEWYGVFLTETEEVRDGAKMTAPRAAAVLERIRKTGERFRGYRDYAERLKCSVGTIRNAIKLSNDLKVWTKKKKAARTQPLNDVVLDSVEQIREAAPDDGIDATFRRMIDAATGPQRAKLHAMPEADRREFAAWVHANPEEDWIASLEE